MFFSKDMMNPWDGSKNNNGNNMGEGVYSIEIKYRVLPEEDLIQIGTVTLLR